MSCAVIIITIIVVVLVMLIIFYGFIQQRKKLSGGVKTSIELHDDNLKDYIDKMTDAYPFGNQEAEAWCNDNIPGTYNLYKQFCTSYDRKYNKALNSEFKWRYVPIAEAIVTLNWVMM